eukprot:SAG22_NODE_527_length_9437_cov_3.575712_12_plen_91_part_00
MERGGVGVRACAHACERLESNGEMVHLHCPAQSALCAPALPVESVRRRAAARILPRHDVIIFYFIFVTTYGLTVSLSLSLSLSLKCNQHD